MFPVGATGLDENRLFKQVIEVTNPNVRPVNNSLDAVNVTLDITFHGVIEMVSNISECLNISYY